MRFSRKILSYIKDIEIETVRSDINFPLVVLYSNSKYILDSEGLNYSYGTLQKNFEREFYYLGIIDKKIGSVLLLGLGVGSLVQSLREKFNKKCRIVAIEADPKMIETGIKYFELDKFRDLVIVQDDASKFLDHNSEQFDLVIVDIYIGKYVPEFCETVDFLEKLKESLSDTGLLIFNKCVCDDVSAKSAKELINNFKRVFGRVKLGKVSEYKLIYDKMENIT